MNASRVVHVGLVLASSFALALSVWGLGPLGTAMADGPNVVISQVYGGGGNTGAPFQNDFIEIYNRGRTTVDLSGWSVQYTAAPSSSGNFGRTGSYITPLSGSLAPGQYLLIQESSGGGAGVSLPTPDITDDTPINLSATDGKVALATIATSLGCNGGSTPCSAFTMTLIVDLVGYGSASFYEGSGPAPAPSNTTADFRAGAGCTDANSNSADFATAAPSPRSSSSPASLCSCNSQVTTGNWSNPATWSCGNPASTALAVIQNGHAVTLDVNANVYDLDINSGGALVGADNVITATGTLTNNGTLTQTLPVNGSSNIDFFNTGNYGGVTINANGANLGSTVVVIHGNQQCDTRTSTVLRCFDIAPSFTGSPTVTFYFASTEMGTQTCGSTLVWHSTGMDWEPAGTVLSRQCLTSPFSVTVAMTVTTFSPFVLSDVPSGPTAVTLSAMRAVANAPVWPLPAVLAVGGVTLIWLSRRRKQCGRGEL